MEGRRFHVLIAVVGLCLLGGRAYGEPQPGFEIDTPIATMSRLPLQFSLIIGELESQGATEVEIQLDGAPPVFRTLGAGRHELQIDEIRPAPGKHELVVSAGGISSSNQLRVIPVWLSILPPIIAIALALLTREVLLSLFSGLLAGALFLTHWNPFSALARTVDTFIVPAVADPDHTSILVFTTLLGGMVALLSRNGGTLGIVEHLHGFATNVRRGQLATWTLGVLIFFDDYANTLIVGSTMRPITDRLRISREKLAYIVDSTAAPVASLFPVSSWIGFEVGLIAAAFAMIDVSLNPYSTFLASIPYRFYPIFALVLGFTIAASGRDFGPMLKAERRARKTGKVLADDAMPLAEISAELQKPPAGAPHRAFNAVIPIVAVVVVTVGGLIASGGAGLERSDFPTFWAWLREAFGNGDSYAALCWASLTGVILGFGLALMQRILTAREGIEAMVAGFKSVFMALIVLMLAWSIGSVCEELRTADYLVALTSGILSPQLVPTLTFVISAAVAFATGSSWGTLGILMPLVVPIAHGLAIEGGLEFGSSGYSAVLVGTISSVLAGSVWGDHCSPISDTTILSSTASGSDHIAHVRTQLPYAFSMGVLGMLIGDLPTAFGLSPWISLAAGAVVIVGGVMWLGQRSEPSSIN